MPTKPQTNLVESAEGDDAIAGENGLRHYVTLAELARRLNLSFRAADRLAARGVLRPDGLLGSRGIYLESRIPELSLAVVRSAFDEGA